LVGGSMIIVSGFCAKTIIVVSDATLPPTRRVVSKFRHERFQRGGRFGIATQNSLTKLPCRAALLRQRLDLNVVQLIIPPVDWITTRLSDGEILLS
jgi:hypothetical protein